MVDLELRMWQAYYANQNVRLFALLVTMLRKQYHYSCDEYALLYEAPRPAVLQAAVLRARAGRLRDNTAQKPDWKSVGQLLQESYRSLKTGLRRES